MAADTGIADDGSTQLNLPSVAQQATLPPTDHGDGSYTFDQILRYLVGLQRTHKIAHATGGRDALVASDIGASQALVPTAVKTTNYTAAAGDLVPVDTTSGAVTITLPTAPADKTRIAVKLVILGGSNAVTIARSGSDVFNKAGGSTSLTLSLLFQAVNLQYKASGGIWYVVADDLPLGDLDARFVAGQLDTDSTLAANSDTRVPSQKAVKTYADQLIAAADAMVFKGVIDCSANPNYPTADRGWTYRVSVAGKIGGASGTNVEVGDLLLCLTDGTASGTQAGVGANWEIAQANIDGAVTGPASSTDNDFATFNGTGGKVVKDSGLSLDTDGALTANSDSKIPSQKAVKTYAQPLDATLTALAGLATAADKLEYWTGTDTATLTTLSAFIRTLLDDADAATARTTLGLGSMATKSSVASADIDDGTIVNADIASGAAIASSKLADGSLVTGAAQKSSNLSDLGSAATARTNLGVASATDIDTLKGRAIGLRAGTTSTAPGANVAEWVRITVERQFTPNRFGYYVETQSGNIDIAIAPDDGTGGAPGSGLLYHSGSFACPAAGRQLTTISSPPVLTPGVYWLGIVADNGTAAFTHPGLRAGRTSDLMRSKASSFPLPDPPATTGTIDTMPCLWIERA